MYLHSRMRGFLPAAIALLLCVSGCADDAPNNKEVSAQEVSQISAPADGTMSKDGLVKKDSTKGTLPADPYRLPDDRLQTYAENLYIANCMKQSGYEYPVQTYDWNDPATPLESPPGYNGRFTVAKAQAYGYHLSSKRREEWLKIDEQRNQLLKDSVADKTFTACGEKLRSSGVFKASDKLGGGVAPYVNDVSKLPAVRAAAQRWRKCMAPQGIADLPEEPQIAQSVATKFGLVDGGDSAVSAEEIKLAVADAKCREQSGYEQLVYDLQWVGQEQILARDPNYWQARLKLVRQATNEYKTYINTHRNG